MITAAVILDVILLAVLVAEFTYSWRRGLITSVLGMVGLVGGAALALWGMPLLLAEIPELQANPLARTTFMLLGVLTAGLIGLSVLGGLGTRMVTPFRDRVLGRIDNILGAIVGTAVTAVVMGLVALATLPVSPPQWRQVMTESVVVTNLTQRMPPALVNGAADVTRTLYESAFPKVFGDPGDEPSLPAEEPDSSAAQSEGVRRASGSVVRITATMGGCGRAGSGSGWVVEPGRVVTNAHVVAGATHVTVQPAGTRRLVNATVVGFDPRRDLAVLAAPGLRAPALERSGPLAAGTDVAVAGFPLGGPYRVQAARVRGTVDAAGQDIYNRPGADREVYSLYAEVRPGNSGGPLLTTDGRVAGTIFARSLSAGDTAFALTDRTTDSMLDRAASLRSPVDTGACVSG